MLAKLPLYPPVPTGYSWGPAVEELEINLIGDAGSKPAIAWSVSRPAKVQLYILQSEFLPSREGRPLGWVDHYQWLHLPESHIAYWLWHLAPEDVAQLERQRGGYDLRLELRCSGLGLVPDQSGDPRLVRIRGSANVLVPTSTWERILTNVLEYQPARWLELPLESSHWPDWERTVAHLNAAVGHLARGETHDALRECLDLLERRQSAPYAKDKWKGKFDVDPHKEEGLQLLISGIAGYLNKIGHHRSRTATDATGDLLRTPVDQWEAEIAVAMTQLLIAYISRLPAKLNQPSP